MKTKHFWAYILIMTVVFVSGCDKKNESDARKLLQLNGVYYCEEIGYTTYFRFYEDGKVIELISIEKFNDEILRNWSYESYDDLIGKYVIKNNRITFLIQSAIDTIEYTGIINDGSITLNSHSNINGNEEKNKIYTFTEIEWESE